MQIDLKKSNHPQAFSQLVVRILWAAAWSIASKGPRLLSPIRISILRLFGAKIGKDVLICGGVKVLMPWNLTIADVVAVGERVDIYNFAPVLIGSQTVISQDAILCTGTHDYTRYNFPLNSRPVSIGKGCWLAMGCFICPGVHIGDGSVVGARAVVTKSVDEFQIVAGNPAKAVKKRSFEGEI